MQQNNISLFLIKILYTLVSIICVLNIFELTTWITFLFSGVLMIASVLILFNLKSRLTQKDALPWMNIFFSVVNILISFLIHDDAITVGGMKKVILFMITILYFDCASRMQIDRKTADWIGTIINLASVVFLIAYFANRDAYYVSNIFGDRYLYFNYYNPNLASLFFMIFALFHLASVEKSRGLRKMVHIVLMLFMIYLVFETRCRNTLLVLIAYLVVVVLFRLRTYSGLRYNRLISYGIAAWPLMLSGMYASIINLLSTGERFGFLMIGGKQVDTRGAVWNEAFDAIFDSPLVGDYAFSTLRQSHNLMIDTWVAYGLIPLLLVIVFLAGILHHDGRVYRSKAAFLYMAGFACCIVTGMAEAALFVGSQGLFVLAGAFILLARFHEAELAEAEESRGEMQ